VPALDCRPYARLPVGVDPALVPQEELMSEPTPVPPDIDGDGRPDPPGASPWPRWGLSLQGVLAAVTITGGRLVGAWGVYKAAGETARPELAQAVLSEVTAAGWQGLALAGVIVLAALGAEGLIVQLLSVRAGPR
jgi:hypothetical protein